MIEYEDTNEKALGVLGQTSKVLDKQELLQDLQLENLARTVAIQRVQQENTQKDSPSFAKQIEDEYKKIIKGK